MPRDWPSWAGRPVVTRMIQAMGLTGIRSSFVISSKCRPPNNREPAPDEISACWPHLDEQLRIINPEVIVALGKPAAQTLLRTTVGLARFGATGTNTMSPARR